MDVRVHANPPLQYAVNGGARRNPRLSEDNDMRYLSQEEQECIQFFEDTIISLEESLNEDDQRSGQMTPAVEVVDRPLTSSPNPGVTVSSPVARPLSPKDQDIIDLVQPEPDLVQTRESNFIPTSPDFQSLLPAPESHFEIKPRHDSLPSEYNPPLPSGSYGPTDSHSSYHPPGSIPTPVLIAQKIAENQAGGTSTLLPPSLLHRRSFDSDKPPSYNADHPPKHGPPTSAKPSRYPANISMILGSKEHQNQSLANVNIQERRTQMLANLTGTSHPLLQENTHHAAEERVRNIPTRSISFKDPTPDKSRMEALSKLGLTRNRAMSGGTSFLATPLDPPTDAETSVNPLEASAKPLEASAPPVTETSSKLPEPKITTPPLIHQDKKAEILRTNSLRNQEQGNPQPSHSPPAVTQSSYHPPPAETKAPTAPPSEVTSLEFNSYGGKSIVVKPSVSSKTEPETLPTSHEPKILSPALANPSEFNTYGGKTKVMTPVPVSRTRNDLPDILSSHIDKSKTLPDKSETVPIMLNSYGGKSRTINPSHRTPENSSKSVKAPPPATAPRPARHSFHNTISPPKAAQRALSPDHRRKSAPMFRPQGITVQFSGRGATNESRREALKKLGLLKDS